MIYPNFSPWLKSDQKENNEYKKHTEILFVKQISGKSENQLKKEGQVMAYLCMGGRLNAADRESKVCGIEVE